MTSGDLVMVGGHGGDAPAHPRRLAISDVHGYVDALKDRLRDERLIDATQRWTGGATRIWFLGDYVDRGRRGLEVIGVVRRLADEAVSSGGSVTPLLGNHELQFLAALHFGDRRPASDTSGWRSAWLRYGGIEEELRAVDDATVEWMTALPLVALDGDDLLLHSDTHAYLQLGRTVDEINATGLAILTGRDPEAWASLHRVLVQRGGFRSTGSPDGLLSQLGARRVVHGHSPLIGSFGLPADRECVPHVYAAGRAVAIDGGVFEGGCVVVAEL